MKAIYNNIVGIFLNPRNTLETRNQIKRILMSFEDYVVAIINNISDIISYMKHNKKKDLPTVINAYSLYTIILSQLNKGVFYKITDADINRDVKMHMNTLFSKREENTPYTL